MTREFPDLTVKTKSRRGWSQLMTMQKVSNPLFAKSPYQGTCHCICKYVCVEVHGAWRVNIARSSTWLCYCEMLFRRSSDVLFVHVCHSYSSFQTRQIDRHTKRWLAPFHFELMFSGSVLSIADLIPLLAPIFWPLGLWIFFTSWFH